MATKLDNITAVPDLKKPGITVHLSEVEASTLVESFINTMGSPNDRTPISGTEINDFFPLVRNTLISRQKSDGVEEDKFLLFIEEDPPEDLDTEAITFFLKHRIPGRFDQGPAGVGNVKEVRAHIRSLRDHPQHPSEKLITMGRFYDNWIVFNIYAKTNKQARERLLWFEKVMDSFDWYFRIHGYRVIEETVGSKERSKISEHLTLTKYPITYMVRTDDTYQISTQELKEIIINVEVIH
jgi:hypothetical protein